MKNPCDRACPKRTSTCHSDCPDYAEFAAKREKERIAAAARKYRSLSLIKFLDQEAMRKKRR